MQSLISPFSSSLAYWIRAFCAVIALAILILGQSAQAQSQGGPVIFPGQAQSVIVAPTSLTSSRNMNFGKIAPKPTAGNVILNPATDTCTTTNTLLRIGLCQSAIFAGMGQRNFTVRINTPASVTLTGPGTAMVLDTITLDVAPDLTPVGNGNGNGNGNPRYSIVSPTGIFTFNVGGTLHVGANQAPGAYSGTFSITVVYQ